MHYTPKKVLYRGLGDKLRILTSLFMHYRNMLKHDAENITSLFNDNEWKHHKINGIQNSLRVWESCSVKKKTIFLSVHTQNQNNLEKAAMLDKAIQESDFLRGHSITKQGFVLPLR